MNGNDFTYLKYIDNVLRGKIPVCKKAKQAVQRHVDDMKRAESGSFPYVFDHNKAQKAILFFSQLVHTKGKLAGEKLKCEPWQQFIIASLYGWRRRDNNKRRFRRAYIQVARKNGKSFIAAGVALYDLMTEPGAEVVSAATKKEQARIVFEDAKKTVQYSPDFKKYIKPLAHSLICGDGSMKPLAFFVCAGRKSYRDKNMTKAKTTEQHKREGTYKKSRHEETAHDYSAMTDMEPPECLTAKAKEVWKRMVPDLVNIGAVEIDRTELTDAFLNYGSAQCCLEQLEGVDLGILYRVRGKNELCNARGIHY